MDRRPLYPEIEPFDRNYLEVDAPHRIYYEQCGNPAGKPVVFLHGGPGSGFEAKHRRFWDPTVYRVVLFDQRGCGHSTPHLELTGNTTWDLVRDIERLRLHLGIERWQVFGGSWGSTLALAYAQTHPDRVLEMILRGVFLARKSELDWMYVDGARRIFPEAWSEFEGHIPLEERGDLLAAYHKRLTHGDARVRERAARAWTAWEMSISKLLPSQELIQRAQDGQYSAAIAAIEAHYFVNNVFLESEGQLLAQVDRIRHVPAVIVQGRYDMVCPFVSAWDLHRAWPESKLVVAADAGHSAGEESIVDALIRATDGFRPMR